MARIVFADDGIQFDGRTIEERPLGGVETSVVFLLEELAKRGHEVIARNKCAAPLVHNGVDWAPIGGNMHDEADLYIANRGDKLLPLMPRAKRTVFWIHNPAQYLLKWRYLFKLWGIKAALRFIGGFYENTLSPGAPAGGSFLIPSAPLQVFR